MNGRTKRRLLTVLEVMSSGLFLFVISAQSATFHVSDPSEFQSALTTAAANGEDDLIVVLAGYYSIASTLTHHSSENYSLTLSGEGRDTTILDGGNGVQIFSASTLHPRGNITVQGMTFQRGSTSGSGGGLLISVSDAASITISNCAIMACAVTAGDSIGAGANLQAEGGVITVASCRFDRNDSAGNVGALYAGTDDGEIVLHQCQFYTNRVMNSGTHLHYGDGAGAMLYSDGASRIRVIANLFDSNVAAGDSEESTPDGGGIMTYQLGAGSSVLLMSNTFHKNEAQLGGGGCITRLNAGGNADFLDNTFTENRTLIGSGAGALLHIQDGVLNYAGNIHRLNQAAEDGSAARIDMMNGVATISSNLFSGNRSANNGGGLAVGGETSAFGISRNIFDTNTAGNVGGGLSFSTREGALTLAHNTFYGNTAENDGGAAYLYFQTGAAQTTMRNNILRQGQPNELAYSYETTGPALTMTYSCVENGAEVDWFGAGCIDALPLFLDPPAGNFNLTWLNYPQEDATRSPCIDSGDPASPLDPDGTRADMGALYYHQGPAFRPHMGISLSNDEASISWSTQNDTKPYQLQYSTNLLSRIWSNAGVAVIGNGLVHTSLVHVDLPQAYYRVTIQEGGNP